jgi:hypothetical protein
MAGPSGADGQVGFKTETTVGTAVTVDQFVPIKSESIKNDITYLDTETISARKVLRLTKAGSRSVGGDLTTELSNVTVATLLKHAFGTVNTTGAGPYTHTYTPGDLTGKSMTVQVGRPATTGTIHPFTYAGMKVQSWQLSCQVDQIAELVLSLIGMSEATGTALATASYAATWSPFTFVEGSVSVGGSAVASVKSFNLSGTNAIEHRHRIGSSASLQPLEAGLRDYSGEIVTDFDALTHYALYTGNTATAVVLTFTNGANTLTITMNVQFTGETPTIDGFDLLEQTLPFRAISTTSDANAITAVLVNTETSAV